MHAKKVLRRVALSSERPDALYGVARDIGDGMARAQRGDLAAVARAVAGKAGNTGDAGDAGAARADAAYWAGFSAAMGVILASYEAAHDSDDARAAAERVLSSPSAESALLELARAPQTGAELAARLGMTPGATSKILKTLRRAGLARVLGGVATSEPIPERGARKPHALTPLGSAIARSRLPSTSVGILAVEARAR